MKKTILITFILFISVNLIAQQRDEYGIDYSLENGYKVFMPTWSNIKNSIKLQEDDFKDLMDYFRYEYNVDADMYILSTTNHQGIYGVKQERNGITFTWGGTTLNVSELKNDLKEFYLGRENDIDTYEIQDENGKLVFKIKDNNSVLGFVAFFVERN